MGPVREAMKRKHATRSAYPLRLPNKDRSDREDDEKGEQPDEGEDEEKEDSGD
jgi:hypothetical protein